MGNARRFCSCFNVGTQAVIAVKTYLPRNLFTRRSPVSSRCRRTRRREQAEVPPDNNARDANLMFHQRRSRCSQVPVARDGARCSVPISTNANCCTPRRVVRYLIGGTSSHPHLYTTMSASCSVLKHCSTWKTTAPRVSAMAWRKSSSCVAAETI